MTTHRLIAFYLPQYHPIPENDAWWGKGFTEWNNVVKGRPLFEGHYQPRLPADLGYYDLRLPEVRREQAELAARHGIYGFCYYHYWFNGKRLLHRPFDEVLSSGSPDFPFCLCWANENWTRAWDGLEKDVLIAQRYTPEDDLEHMRRLAEAFRDPRYIRVDGRPLFLVYRVNILPDPLQTAAIWRQEARRLGIGDIYLALVESRVGGLAMPTPGSIGFDAAVEFQPDGLHMPPPIRKLDAYGGIYAYADFVQAMLRREKPDYKRYPCVSPGWDNTPRRRQNQTVLHNSTPELYGRWLQTVAADFRPFSPEENFIFINAWNEWGEGAYLEPDAKWGHSYLEATRSAIENAPEPPAIRTRKEESVPVPARAEEPGAPELSICIPAYNGAKYLGKAIQSVLGQGYRDYELLIVDDQSSDNTEEIVRSFTDPRIVYYRNDARRGLVGNWNHCLSLARAAYVCVFHQDDMMYAGNLERKVRLLRENDAIGFVYSDVRVIGPKDETIGDHWFTATGPRDFVSRGADFFRRLITGENLVCCPGVVMRRSCVEMLSGFDARLSYAVDWEMWLRISLHFDVAYLADRLIGYRVHEANETHRFKGVREIEEIFRAKMIALDQAGDIIAESGALRETVADDIEQRVRAFLGTSPALRKADIVAAVSVAADAEASRPSAKGLAGLKEWCADMVGRAIDARGPSGGGELRQGVASLLREAGSSLPGKPKEALEIMKRAVMLSASADDLGLYFDTRLQVSEIMIDKGQAAIGLTYLRSTINEAKSYGLREVIQRAETLADRASEKAGGASSPGRAAEGLAAGPEDQGGDGFLTGVLESDDLVSAVREREKSLTAGVIEEVERDRRAAEAIGSAALAGHLETFGSLLKDLLQARKRGEDLSRIYRELEKSLGSPRRDGVSADKSIKAIAFYLPQYHQIPENDRWWGEGFTEWTNVRKAKPLFPGHYQPHEPADLGYYDLRDPEIREQQAELARRHGIHGFCYYHYWFMGSRLLNLPLDEVLASGRPDFPFCLCWADEHWTRAWDGRQGEILMEQRFSPEDDREHIRWLLRVFQDKRYIRIKGKPLMLIYLSTRMPDASATVALWRKEAARAGEELYLCRVESAPYECYDPGLKGFDAAVEFQPDWGNLGRPKAKLQGDHLVFDYEAVVKQMLAKGIPPYKRFPGVTPMWDNSPRRRQAAVVLDGSTPGLYEAWLAGIARRIDDYRLDENLLFINAWNEWGEGNHLEPDMRHGKAYLEATKRGLSAGKTAVITQAAGGAAEDTKRPAHGLVSIIMLTFNELRYTKECVESIRRHTKEPHEIIFVDNGSADGTVKWLRKLVNRNGRYRLIQNSTNLGFARGCNQGIAAASGEYIMLLNNDVVVTPEWLAGMKECLESGPDIGIVGPLTNNISGIQRLCHADYEPAGLDAFAKGFRERYRHRRILHPRIVGFCMLFRRELVERIGLLDEAFGSGNFEDDDLCLRAELAGLRNCIAGDVFIHHYGSRSFIGNRLDHQRFMTGNRRLFHDKWQKADPADPVGRRLAALSAVAGAEALYHRGRPGDAHKLLVEAMGRMPEEVRLRRCLAKLLIDARQYQDALDLLTGTAGRGADDADDLLLRGLCCEGLDRLDEAAACAEEILRRAPSDAAALNLAGLIAYKKGERSSAADLFRRSGESDPGYGEPWTNLGLLAWAEARQEEALQLLGRGFSLAPQSADVVNNYYQAVTARGAWEQALPLFEDAAALHPLDQRIALLLIDILIRQGKAAAAMPLIEDALAVFGIDEGMLEGALAVRRSLGTREIPESPETPSLSLCMIARNEERNIARSLGSVKSLVQEMIVVDTGSTDRTREIAEAFGAKVYDFPWTEDFSEARNVSIEKARGDWVLILDADETISPRDHAALRSLIRLAGAAPAGFAVTTRSYTLSQNVVGWTPNRGDYPTEEEGSGWFPGTKVRIFRRDDRIRFRNPVHEAVEPSLEAAGIPVRSCPVPIHHYGKLDESRTALKGETYYRLGLRKLEETGDTVDALRELAVQARELGKFDEALALWQRLLLLSPDCAVALLNIGSILLDTGQYQEALGPARRAAEVAPGMKEALLNCALAELYAGEAERSVTLLEELAAREPEYETARVSLCLARCALKGSAAGCMIGRQPMGPGFEGAAADVARRLVAAGRFECAARMVQAVLESGAVNDELKEIRDECEERRAAGAA